MNAKEGHTPEDTEPASVEMVLNDIQNTLGILHGRLEAVESRSESPDHLAAAFATSPAIDKLFTALMEASAKFGEIKKLRTAKIKGKTEGGTPYSYEYKYADLSDVIAATVPHLAEAKIVVTQPIIRVQDGVCVITMMVHESGQWMRSNLTMPLADRSAQKLGGASTYGRRYALCAMLGVASEDDDDGNLAERAVGNGNEPRAGTRTVTTPKGNKPKPESKPSREPPPAKRELADDHGEGQKVSDALDDYLEATEDKRQKRVILAEALGKPWPTEPSEMDRLTVIGVLNQRATKAESSPDPYVPSDGKGNSLPDGES